jgi:spore maturation protein CgeB
MKTILPDLPDAASFSERKPDAQWKNTVEKKGASLRIVVLGLSITSSWGNGHATTYRALLHELSKREHSILFLERDAEWYASNRDLPNPPFCRTEIYESFSDLKERFGSEIRGADLVIVGSFVPEGIVIGDWVTSVAGGATAFYDIDTPVTLSLLGSGRCEYLTPKLVSRYNLYLSFTGGPTLDLLQDRYGSPMARALFCSVDPSLYHYQDRPMRWDLAYMGTYSDDRQPTLDKLLIQPAVHWNSGRFAVVGPQYPKEVQWPGNVERVEHLSPREHSDFYNSQRFTLNVTRADMIRAGYSPSVRLFEAGACGTPIITDYWPGLESFFAVGREILVARTAEESLMYIKDLSEGERKEIGKAAQKTILSKHTASHRAAELEQYAFDLINPTMGGA